MQRTLFFLLLCLAGCATPIQPNQTLLTFVSVPPGAMIYEGQNAWGVAPQVKIYTSTNGVAKTIPITAIWASGARYTTSFNITLGARQTATFSRPPNAPGLDKDLMFAEQLRQADAARTAELAASIAGAIRSAQPAPAPAPVFTNCTKVGNSVNCISQ